MSVANLLHVLTNKCDILPKIKFKTVNSTSVFSLKFRLITTQDEQTIIVKVFGSSDEFTLLIFIRLSLKPTKRFILCINPLPYLMYDYTCSYDWECEK